MGDIYSQNVNVEPSIRETWVRRGLGHWHSYWYKSVLQLDARV